MSKACCVSCDCLQHHKQLVFFCVYNVCIAGGKYDSTVSFLATDSWMSTDRPIHVSMVGQILSDLVSWQMFAAALCYAVFRLLSENVGNRSSWGQGCWQGGWRGAGHMVTRPGIESWVKILSAKCFMSGHRLSLSQMLAEVRICVFVAACCTKSCALGNCMHVWPASSTTWSVWVTHM